MNAIELLTSRSSCSKLELPLPNSEQLDIIYRSALRAPDHAGLRPWKFLVYQSPEALKKLGEQFVAATEAEEGPLDSAKKEKLLAMPSRAPMVIVAIAEYQSHDKVPKIEQAISCGCAVHGMLLAAQSLGFAGYWRTGPLAFNANLKTQLGVKPDDEIVGFLYLGSPKISVNKPDQVEVSDFFKVIG